MICEKLTDVIVTNIMHFGPSSLRSSIISVPVPKWLITSVFIRSVLNHIGTSTEVINHFGLHHIGLLLFFIKNIKRNKSDITFIESLFYSNPFFYSSKLVKQQKSKKIICLSKFPNNCYQTNLAVIHNLCSMFTPLVLTHESLHKCKCWASYLGLKC